MATILNRQMPESNAVSSAPFLLPVNSTLYSGNQQVGPYTYYDLAMSYEGDMGCFIQPVSGLPTILQIGPGGGLGSSPVAAEIIQLEAPWMIVEGQWTARRTGLPVELPDWRPFSASSKFTIKAFKAQVQAPTLTDGETYVFHASGFLRYYMKIPLTPMDGLPMPAAPYQLFPAGGVGMIYTQFLAAILPSGSL